MNDGVDVAALTLDALEDRLASLASQIAAAECDFLLALAEFEQREGWGRSGMKSAAAWLSWRTGMRLGVARDRVRVARALQRLPLITDAFRAGRLSYCKVRALARVATAPTEAVLLEIALGATGAQLETICRQWRRTLIGEQAASRHLRRGVTRREEADGSVTYTVRVAPEDAAVVDAALAAGREQLTDDGGRPVETPEETRLAEAIGAGAPLSRVDADVLVLIAETFLAANAETLPEGRTHVIVHADLDALAEAAALEAGAEPVEADTPAAPSQPSDDAEGTPVWQRTRATRPPACRTSDGTVISASTVMRMLCSSTSQLLVSARDGRPLDLARTRRHASAQQRIALAERDHGCRFPGCTQTRRLVPHHSVYWSRGGGTDLDLLVLLCPTHHRAVHELGYRVTALGGGRFRFVRPDGVTLPESGVMGANTPDNVTPLPPRDPWTIAPLWGGERLDLGLLIGGLADTTLIRAGHIPRDISYRDLDETLRAAAQWPAA